ncbi:MAG TPA: dihydroorotase [Rectinemataceae bacterium]|nr:dihydroorotase [Rectinemataceae bacterium]
MRLLFRNARLVGLPPDESEATGDLLVEDGRIADLGPGAASRAETSPSRASPERASPVLSIDCAKSGSGSGPLVLMPAFIDLHAHFRDPGFPEKETIESGCLAAAAGGFGTVVAMANTKPATDDPNLARDARVRALALGLIDYLPAIAATRGLEGHDVSHLDALEAFLAADPSQPEAPHYEDRARIWLRVISDDGRDAADDATLLAAMRKAADLGLLVACHCERGAFGLPPGHEASGWYSSPEGMEADRSAEIRGVGRAIRLAKVSGCALHLCHLSTRESVELVRREKRRAIDEGGAFRLSCEVTPHHLALGAAEARAAGAAGAGRVNPWLREEDDRLALLEGLRDGTIAAIATDHAPHGIADKAGGAPGFSGLETAFALAHTGLGKLGLGKLSTLMSAAPASILGLKDRGRLAIGLRADLVLVDPEAEWRVDSSRFLSRGRNSLLEGRLLRGRVLMTIHEGRIVYDQL